MKKVCLAVIEFSVRLADLSQETDAAALIKLLGLAAEEEKIRFARSAFLAAFRAHSTAFAVFAENSAQKKVGVALCYLGFSAFSARATLRIHRLFVQKSARKKGAARALIKHLEAAARSILAESVIWEAPFGECAARLGFDAAGVKNLDQVEEKAPAETVSFEEFSQQIQELAQEIDPIIPSREQAKALLRRRARRRKKPTAANL